MSQIRDCLDQEIALYSTAFDKEYSKGASANHSKLQELMADLMTPLSHQLGNTEHKHLRDILKDIEQNHKNIKATHQTGWAANTSHLSSTINIVNGLVSVINPAAATTTAGLNALAQGFGSASSYASNYNNGEGEHHKALLEGNQRRLSDRDHAKQQHKDNIRNAMDASKGNESSRHQIMQDMMNARG